MAPPSSQDLLPPLNHNMSLPLRHQNHLLDLSLVQARRRWRKHPSSGRPAEQNIKKTWTCISNVSTWYKDAKENWKVYHAAQLKLQEKILETVTKQKAAKLRADLPVRTWLRDLKASTAPPENVTKRSISVEYHRFIGYGNREWPSGGPSNWLAKWEELLTRAEQFGVSFDNWLTDVSTVWGEVPELAVYFRTVEGKVIEGKEAKYTPVSIASAIQQHWERKREGTAVKFSRPRTTRSTFATDATFNGEETPEAENTTATRKKSNKRHGRRPANKDDHKPDSSSGQTGGQGRSKRVDNKDDSFPCSACGGTKHCFKKCYLVWGKERDWIPDESRELLRENMKNSSFKKRVDDERKRREKQTESSDAAE